jgi:hypothetical protein
MLFHKHVMHTKFNIYVFITLLNTFVYKGGDINQVLCDVIHLLMKDLAIIVPIIYKNMNEN